MERVCEEGQPRPVGPGVQRRGAELVEADAGGVGLTAARAGIELSIEAGIDAIRAKCVALTEYAIELADTAVAPLGVSVDSPRDPARRGSHVALVHPEARTLTAALAARQVISDFGAPDVIRFGLSPLRSTFADVLAGVGALRALLLE